MKLFSKGKKKKSPAQKAYEAKLTEAQTAQRSGDIQRYAELMGEADELAKHLTPEGPGA